MKKDGGDQRKTLFGHRLMQTSPKLFILRFMLAIREGGRCCPRTVRMAECQWYMQAEGCGAPKNMDNCSAMKLELQALNWAGMDKFVDYLLWHKFSFHGQ